MDVWPPYVFLRLAAAGLALLMVAGGNAACFCCAIPADGSKQHKSRKISNGFRSRKQRFQEMVRGFRRSGGMVSLALATLCGSMGSTGE